MNTAPTAATAPDATTRLRVAGCPEPGCDRPAEVYDEVDLASTAGSIRHARTRCLGGHWFFLPWDYIPRT
jgi:hypothetical protein